MSTTNATTPVELTDAELDLVTGGAITDNFIAVKRNGGGNTPKGEANGVPTVEIYVNSTNPAGFAPPGQQLG